MGNLDIILKSLNLTKKQLLATRYYKEADIRHLEDLHYGEWTMEDISILSKLSGKTVIYVVNTLKKMS
ncbi:hypothetical protein BAU18_001561 [Enterococcus diestrammenae]|uniref:Uncharacterized protein n=1 Tax=Enterococcus diestrammenae TaxID=1155073 RepID=A0ABV0F1N6_9ENTE|nr:hypothetical protein BAU18_05930 [Enterococcus diestrammenae]